MSQAELDHSRTRHTGGRTGDPSGARVILSKGQEARCDRSSSDEHLEHESRKHIWKEQTSAEKHQAEQLCPTWERQGSRLEGWGPEGSPSPAWIQKVIGGLICDT